jgi:hypothetical protein
MIANTLTALADTEDERGHGAGALGLERDALRYSYLADDVTGIAGSYHNHGTYLRRHAGQPVPALASHVAATLIYTLLGTGSTNQTLDALNDAATDLREIGTAAVPPASVADLGWQLSDIPGTNLSGLTRQLSPHAETVEHALRDLIAKAQKLAAARVSDER